MKKDRKEPVKIDIDSILAQVKITVLAYQMKNMPAILGYTYETISNQIDHRDKHKLGFISFLQILTRSAAIRVKKVTLEQFR